MSNSTPAAPAGATCSTERPESWLGDHGVLGLACAATRIKALQLTQLLHGERFKAVACHDFVRSVPLQWSARRTRGAGQVLSTGRGTAMEKADLLVALLRSSGIAARLRVYSLPADHLRGIAGAQATVLHPVVEAFLANRWVGTDTFHLDASLALAARRRLLHEGSRCGWGVRLDGAATWDGRNDAFCILTANAFDWGVFRDSADFAQTAARLAVALKPASSFWGNWRVAWTLGRLRHDAAVAAPPGLKRA